ncbi:unnamed protein product [Arctogadus glacialis]
MHPHIYACSPHHASSALKLKGKQAHVHEKTVGEDRWRRTNRRPLCSTCVFQSVPKKYLRFGTQSEQKSASSADTRSRRRTTAFQTPNRILLHNIFG